MSEARSDSKIKISARPRFKNLILFVGILTWTIFVGAADVSDWNQARMRQTLRSFEGNYKIYVGSKWTEALIVNEGGHLTLWYVVGGNRMASSFEIPISRINRVVTNPPLGPRWGTPFDAKQVTFQQSAYDVHARTMTHVMTEQTSRRRLVSTRQLALTNDGVYFYFRRTYFKRKFILFGSWVRDQDSFEAQNYSSEQRFLLVPIPGPKISSKDFFERARLNDGRPLERDQLMDDESIRNMFDPQAFAEDDEVPDLRPIEPVSQPWPPVKNLERRSAEIIHINEFRSRKGKSCESDLKHR